MERLQEENRSLRADAERLQQANRLVTAFHVLLLVLSIFRADTERLQQTHQTEMRSLRADAQSVLL